ncbi:hypothetical protein [Bacillus sp. ZHX3]|uniref:hypothetical protein n=1 Tax=Bacillus sp. ZHX3 TaxID=2841656 RepID=UPI00200F6196|nr:hypothetical protein [Bacillus sp. ZHX3]
MKSETQEKERWQSIARQEADRADEKDQRLQELQSRIHSEVEASKGNAAQACKGIYGRTASGSSAGSERGTDDFTNGKRGTVS